MTISSSPPTVFKDNGVLEDVGLGRLQKELEAYLNSSLGSPVHAKMFRELMEGIAHQTQELQEDNFQLEQHHYGDQEPDNKNQDRG